MNANMLDLLMPAVALCALVVWLCFPPFRRTQVIKQSAIFIVATALLFGVSWLLYAWVRSPFTLPELQLASNEQAMARNQLDVLKVETKKAPEDPKAWLAMGDFLIARHAFPQAAESYRHATLLSRAAPDMLLRYVRALILSGDGEIGREARRGMDALDILARDNPQIRREIALYRTFSDCQARPTADRLATLTRLLADTPLPPIMREWIEAQRHTIAPGR